MDTDRFIYERAIEQMIKAWNAYKDNAICFEVFAKVMDECSQWYREDKSRLERERDIFNL